jgi:hypothetical protein
VDEESLELKENISRMPDEQLLEIVRAKPGEYRDEALYFAKKELEARRIDFTEPAVAEVESSTASMFPSLDTRGLKLICANCGGTLREGVLVAEKELTIIFSDTKEERFVRVNACSQCGQIVLVADYETEVQP